MVTVTELYKNAQALLKSAGIESYRFDASCIMEQVFDANIHRLLLNPQMPADEHSIELIQHMLEKRKNGFPLQYILGEWEFYGLPFKVGNGVLIPRQDTETLVELVLDYAGEKRGMKIADLCSGSGCIAVAVEKNLDNPDVCAIENSPEAFQYLMENIRLNNSNVNAVQGDVLDKTLADSFESLDIVVSNPPYLTSKDMEQLQTEVSFEPQSALYGGSDGLLFYKNISRIWHDTLKSRGVLAFEIGIGQENDVKNILESNNFYNVSFKRDLNGIIRTVAGFKM